MKKICMVTPEIGREKGGIQNWMYYIKCLLDHKNFSTYVYAYKEDKILKILALYKKDIFILATWKMSFFILPLLFLANKKVFVFVHGNEILNLNIVQKSILYFLTKRKNTYFIANSYAISNLLSDVTKRKADFIQYPFMEIKDNGLNRNKKSIFFISI